MSVVKKKRKVSVGVTDITSGIGKHKTLKTSAATAVSYSTTPVGRGDTNRNNNAESTSGRRGNTTRLRNHNVEPDQEVEVGQRSRGAIEKSQRGAPPKKIVKNKAKENRSSTSPNLAAVGRTNVGANDNTMIGRKTLHLWHVEGEKRSRADIMDVDVVLDMFTDTIQHHKDQCVDAEERTAMKLLDKHLRKDATHMIKNIQEVKSLQQEVKRSGIQIKQAQRRLVEKQDEKLNLGSEADPRVKQEEKNKKILEINQFLEDLKCAIDQANG